MATASMPRRATRRTVHYSRAALACRSNRRKRTISHAISRKTGEHRPFHKKLLHIAHVPVMCMVPRFALAGRGARKPLTTEVFRMAEKVPILVVLGIDIDGKPHAS